MNRCKTVAELCGVDSGFGRLADANPMAVFVTTLYGNMPVFARALSLLERTETKTQNGYSFPVSGLSVISGCQTILTQVCIYLPNTLPDKD